MWTSRIFPEFFIGAYGGPTGSNLRRTNWVTDTIKCAVLTDVYVYDPTDALFASVSTAEIVVTGYTAGGFTLTSKSITFTAANLVTNVLNGEASWNSTWVNGTRARQAVLYNSSATEKQLIAHITFFKDSQGEADAQMNLISSGFIGVGPGPEKMAIMFDAIRMHSYDTGGGIRWFGRAIANNAFGGVAGGQMCQWHNGDIKIALLTNAYVPNLATNEFWSDISANECVGGGYGVVSLTGLELNLSGPYLSLELVAANVDFGSLTLGSARWAVVYDNTPSGKPLMFLVDLQADLAPTAQHIIVNWPGGIVGKIRPAW
jgi:hypothetical protein